MGYSILSICQPLKFSSGTKYWIRQLYHDEHTLYSTAILKLLQGAYKFGKMKFPEFSRFSRPSNQSFPDNHKVKTR